MRGDFRQRRLFPSHRQGSREALSQSDGAPQGLLIAISNEMVRIYKDQFGRGPTRSRTFWCGQDTLIVLLEDTFTAAEHNLRELGEHQRLRDIRTFFQYT